MKAYVAKLSELGSDESSQQEHFSDMASSSLKAIRIYRRFVQDSIQDLWYHFPNEMDTFLSYCENMDNSNDKERLVEVFKPDTSRPRFEQQATDNTPYYWR